MTSPAAPFPLSAVVGQDDLKLTLLLCAVDPRIGGVLIRGEKGSGKSTAARGLAALIPGAPFVELPIGATEDRVVGSLDLEAALVHGQRRLQPGLLAAAHGGVLYVDEVNLLPDHLVDVLIDAAASGINRVERDGITVEHPCRFVLAGSMNPEEGELRPQLLDRFGLAVEVRAPRDPSVRAEVVARRLAYDADPHRFRAGWAEAEDALSAALAGAAGRLADVHLPDEVVAFAAALCAELDAEGLRADLVLARGAKALAALEDRPEATADDVVRLAPMALAHRRRRGPLDAPGLDPGELQAALDRLDKEASPTEPTGEENPGESPGFPHQLPPPDAAGNVPVALVTQRPSSAVGRRRRGPATGGGIVAAAAPEGPVTDVAVAATATAAATRRALAPDAGRPSAGGAGPVAAGGAAPSLVPADLRQAVREARTANLVILAVDASGSMGTHRRMEAAKGAVLSLLLDAYQRRDRVALVTFAGASAIVVLRPTGSVEVARSRLAALPTGGHTPLAAGIRTALGVARDALRQDPARRPVLVLVTDGRATGAGDDPTSAALAAAAEVRAAGLESLVVDAEDGDIRLGLARRLAETLGGSYQALPDLVAADLARAVSDFVET